jgi:hypothetical protein
MGALATTGKSGVSGIVRRAESAAAPEWLEFRVVIPAPGDTYSWRIDAGSSVTAFTDWGDGGAIEAHSGVGTFTHVFAAAGSYTVKIKAAFGSGGAFRLTDGGADRLNLAQLLSPIPAFPGLTSILGFCQSCSGLTGSFPVDFLRYATTLVTANNSFFSTNIGGTLQVDFLRYLPNLTAAGRFLQNTAVTGPIPSGFFAYNNSLSNLSFFFSGCSRLQMTASIFDGGDQTLARNFNNFANSVGTFSGTPQGTAPPLWTYSFGDGTLISTNAFAGNSATNLSNWASIPAAWGGPA